MADTQTTVVIVQGGTGLPNINGLAVNDGEGNTAAQVVQRANGAIVSTANPGPVFDAAAMANAGSILANQATEISLLGTLTAEATSALGADYSSAGAPAGPGNSSTLIYNGSTLALLSTVPASASRRSVEVNNATGSLAVVVLDDGNNTAGTVSLFPLAPGAGPFQQGGDFVPIKEAGRVRVFGVTGSGYVYARET